MAALSTPDPNWNRIAEAAYEAYAQVVRSGVEQLPVPDWEWLGPRYQQAWREAVQEAVRIAAEGS